MTIYKSYKEERLRRQLEQGSVVRKVPQETMPSKLVEFVAEISVTKPVVEVVVKKKRSTNKK